MTSLGASGRSATIGWRHHRVQFPVTHSIRSRAGLSAISCHESACQRVLGQDTEPQNAVSAYAQVAPTSSHQCKNICVNVTSIEKRFEKSYRLQRCYTNANTQFPDVGSDLEAIFTFIICLGVLLSGNEYFSCTLNTCIKSASGSVFVRLHITLPRLQHKNDV